MVVPSLRQASTIVLVRRAANEGYQVLMAKRSSKMKAFASVYVFPGGVTEDVDQEIANRYSPNDSRGKMKVTGIRELFEEAGVLLTKNSDNADLAHPVSAPEWQDKVHNDPGKFQSLLTSLNCEPAIDSLEYIVTFTTPKMEKRRFDTRFFFSIVDDASINIDGGETVEYKWITPIDALRENKNGTMAFLPPQFYVLSLLSKYSDVDGLIHHFKNVAPPTPILPHSVGFENNVLSLCYPGDEEHPEYPGKAGDRRRLHCTMPMGSGGYRYEDNLASRL